MAASKKNSTAPSKAKKVYNCTQCKSKYALSLYDEELNKCKCCILAQGHAALKEEYSTLRDVNSKILQDNTKITESNKHLKDDNKALRVDNRDLRESIEGLKKQFASLLSMQTAPTYKAALMAIEASPTPTTAPTTAQTAAVKDVPGTYTSLQESLPTYTMGHPKVQHKPQAQAPRKQHQPTTKQQQRNLGTTPLWRTARGVKIVPTNPVPVAVPLKNRFSRLHEVDLRPHTYLVGDSIVRHQSSEFKWYDQKKRSVICRPGATIDKITENVRELKCDRKDTIITHCGTNDLKCKRNGLPEDGGFRSEDLIGQYRTLIKELQKKTDSAIISSILPRKYASNCISSRIRYINRAVSKIAVEEGIQYLDLTNEFNHGNLYSPDGLHLSFWGKRKLGELLNRAVSEWSKQQQGNGHNRGLAAQEDYRHRIPGSKT
jgi:hypothetical protein